MALQKLKATGFDSVSRRAIRLLVQGEFRMLVAMMPCIIAVPGKSDGESCLAMMNLEAMGSMYVGGARGLAPQIQEMLEFD